MSFIFPMPVIDHCKTSKSVTTGYKLDERNLFRFCFMPLLLIALLVCSTNNSTAGTYAAGQILAFTQSRAGTDIFVDSDHQVYDFLIKAFEGEYTSLPLAWDPSEPNDNAYAEHKPSVNRKYINIRVSSLLGPLDQVACLVYESMNAQNENQFAAITEEAHKGALDKTEFIHNILRLEHKSLKRTRAFLSHQKGFKDVVLSQTIFYSKMVGTPDDFDAFIEYLHRIKREDYDVFQHYSDFYDFVIPPTRRWKANHSKMTSNSGDITPEEEKEKQ